MTASDSIGIALANRLGLALNKREGHDLVGPCVHCSSSDAFRLHQEKGIAFCYSCGAKWSSYRLAEDVLGCAEQARSLMVELGVFEPSERENGKPQLASPDPLTIIARQKGVSVNSLKAFGAKGTSSNCIILPAYGPQGTQCTTMTLSVRGGKGKFARGKPAGLFFPHDENRVRLPKPGEKWHVVEGPKDAAALHGLGLLAVGMNTCRLAAKFARLFNDVDVILIPDRDRAGENGARQSARVLHGIARSVRIAVLPAEFKKTGGDDVRDVLCQPDGESLLKQAIDDAKPVDDEVYAGDEETGEIDADVTTEIPLPDGEPLRLTVSPSFGKPQRLVVVHRGEVSHRDRFDTDSATSRSRFVKKLARKLGIEVDVLEPLIETAIHAQVNQIDDQAERMCARNDDQPSQATLAAIMAAEWELWHTPDKEAYATVPVGNHVEHWPVRSQTFKRYLGKRFFEEQQTAIGSEVLSAALNLIDAKALFDGEEHGIFIRLAEHESHIYLDLCNDEWQVVEITPNGWKVIEDSPVRFRRSRGMLALPVPQTGGRVDDLRNFLNIDDANWPLLVAWLIAAFRPRGPYPLLALFGEQGSAKSSTGRLLRDLVDPNSAPLRAEPRDVHNLMITANNSWILTFENLSKVQPWLSDALCRLSTGGGFATRELYTNQDEIIFESQRPVLLTSIEEVATRSDLLDRCLVVTLQPIPEEQRRPETEIFAEFHAVRPLILGALLDAVSGALRDLPEIKLAVLPRMADFALWVTAAERSLGWAKGHFLRIYEANRASANEVALESSIVASALLDHLKCCGEWCGTSTELLEVLTARGSETLTRNLAWPKNARSLSGHLRRLAPNFRKIGWDVQYDRNSSRRFWTIHRLTGFASSEKFASQSNGEMGADTECEPMPIDANQCNKSSDDADDANDANAGTLYPAHIESQVVDHDIPF